MNHDPEPFAALAPTRMDSTRRLIVFGAAGVGLAGLIVSPHIKVHADPMSITSAVNRSGRLRALSQRISKAYTQISLDILPEKASEILISSQAIMQKKFLTCKP